MTPPSDKVSRQRYERERLARKEVESLLEVKSRALYQANEELRAQARHLEEEVRRRTADLEAAKTLAEHASEAKSSFLAMISHEIRTPLNGLLGMGAALSESGLNDEQAEMVSLMQSSGDMLLSLLNDILDLSKIEARQMEIESIGFDLPALVEEQCQMYAPRAREKGLSFALHIEDSARRHIQSDPTRLRQVISNLFSNATKFTTSGGIEVRLWVEDGQVRCRVSDTGPGVDPSRQDSLFKAFSQAESSITRRFGGTGLGLAISREMCRLMGGDLVYDAREGGGSEFVASIAAREAVSPPDGHDSADADYEMILVSQPWRVLAAEDNMTNQQVLRLMLRRYGLDMVMVNDGAAAVAAHCSNPFDLILMDVNMPEMNGLEAASYIRQFEIARDLPRVPIIALTANAMTHQVQDYLRQGIDAHVAKPVRREVLARAMAGMLAPLCQGPEAPSGAAADQAECAPSASVLTKDST
ncbi:ATP-binding protein [Tropicibacter oceani]|uniref:histidine kinase n=1 Tax=Tropicibacter oceani TaxID=3058420 RepID=A0ABY8QNQ9_9RHOB|nr:ATP-binding protein [Tropicibacter oceani]WGW05678.1 ATP-binding protein [Tropicibacter oceani]